MSLTPDPPIQLDPSMDNGHQLAFINQNFLSIANVLGKNSFVIVLQGVVTVTATDSGLGAVGDVSVTHNLGFIPVVLAFVNLSGQIWIPLPAVLSSSVSHTAITFTEYAYINGITSSVVEFGYDRSVTGSGSYDIKYYILQQTASS